MPTKTNTINVKRPGVNTSGGATSQSGHLYVTSSGSMFVSDDTTTADMIFAASSNIYVKGPVNQTVNLVMSGDTSIVVYDEKNEPVEGVSQELNVMFKQPKCSLNACAVTLITDLLTWGICPYNWVWKRYEGKLVCEELNHIHPYNLRDKPSGLGTSVVYGRVLQGVIYDKSDRTMNYYHAQDMGSPQKLPPEDIIVFRRSTDLYPDGEATIYPLIPIIQFENYGWNTLSQQMFRTGAPFMFIKITNPQPEVTINGEVIPSDEDYAKEVLKNWGKDTAFVLRPNFELIKVETKEGSLAIVAINKANETIRDYLSPVGMLGGKDGALIGGNSNAQLKLLNNYIQGYITLIESELAALPNYYLRHNGFPETWHAEVHITRTVIEDQTIKLQQAQLGAQTHMLFPNEVRELLGVDPINEDEQNRLVEEWRRLGVQPASSYDTPAEFGNAGIAPSRNSYLKRNRIAREVEAEMNVATDEFESAVMRILRRV